MSTKQIITTKYRLSVSRDLIKSFNNPSDSYYLFAANTVNSANVDQPYDTVRTTSIDAYRSMLFGKKISPSNVSMVIPRHDYVSGTIYTAYDDTNINLYSSTNPFYVTTNEGSNWYVFKCLENNNGGPSTVEPAFADVDGSSECIFYPTDGYRWLYMYTIDSADFATWGTPQYVPVPDVYRANTEGCIHTIKVETAGLGYSNWYNGTFSVSDIKLNGNTVQYALGSDASSNSGFYNGCYIYIASGNGAGQYELISNYTVNSTVKFVTLQNAFGVTPENNWTYEISPSVNIVGDGLQTINAAARAIVNSAGNTIQRVEMLNRGLGYAYTSATVIAADIVGVSSVATVRPIYSPPGGHGYHAPSELGVTGVMLYNQFSNNEANTIFIGNDYSQIGLLKNPMFANVTLSFSTQDNKFLVGETVKKVNLVLLAGVASVNNTSNVVTISSGDPSHLSSGTQIYLNAGTNHQLANVVVSNTTTITIDGVGLFSNATANVYLANTTTSATVSNNPTLSAELTNVTGRISINDSIIGVQSGSLANVSAITINGLSKGFNTFTQTFIYEGQQLNTQFIADETVYQGNVASCNATFVCAANVAGVHRTYVTNQIGNFITGQNMIGLESGAIASVTNKYVPDLVFGSGEVLYVENTDPIPRANVETFRLVLNF